MRASKGEQSTSRGELQRLLGLARASSSSPTTRYGVYPDDKDYGFVCGLGPPDTVLALDHDRWPATSGCGLGPGHEADEGQGQGEPLML